jgi:flagellar basal body-associated protein FliL
MRRKTNKRGAKARGGTLLIVFVVALFVLLLLLRMIAFFAGHGRHHF